MSIKVANKEMKMKKQRSLMALNTEGLSPIKDEFKIKNCHR